MSIYFNNVAYKYDSDFSLNHINLTIQDGEFVGIIGKTGSGKSTLIQHINGLLKPTIGEVIVQDIHTIKQKKQLSKLRLMVGLVFQYSEYQLFESTVEREIAFGLAQLPLTNDEKQKNIQEAMKLMSLDYETYKNRNPFSLSGGEKRRVAIASILAMKPKILILDEPTTGLDPKTRKEFIGLLQQLKSQTDLTLIIVSHNMNDIGVLTDRIIVLDNGTIVLDDSKEMVFQEYKLLKKLGLEIPSVTYIGHELRKKGFVIPRNIFTIEEAKNAIISYLKEKNKSC